MKQLADGSIDLVVTSPPYNLGIKYDTYNDQSDRTAFISWCVEWAAELKRVMSDEASFFLNLGAAPKNPLLPHQLHSSKHLSLGEIDFRGNPLR